MKEEEIQSRLIAAGYGPEIIRAFTEVMVEEIPEYKFSLREDLKNEKQFLPTKAESKASGWDVRAAMPDKRALLVKPFEFIKIPLGIRSFCPEGWWYEIKPRSSTFLKKNLHALYGTIDETYEGELVFACQYIPEGGKVKRFVSCFFNDDALVISYGDAIGQLIPVKRQEMKVVECSNEEYDNICKERNGARGTGGFGSTGR